MVGFTKGRRWLWIVVAIVATPIVIISVAVGLFCIMWEIDHNGEELSAVENHRWRLTVVYYPGGLGTNPEVRVFAAGEAQKKELLLYADAHDTAGVFFRDSVTAGVVLYGRQLYEPWDRFPNDTFYFKLDKRVSAVYMRSVAR